MLSGGTLIESLFGMKKLLLLSFIALSACVPKNNELDQDKKFETSSDYYLVPESNSGQQIDPIRQKLSYFFLVEQFNVGAHESMLTAIKKNPPGGILFWNGNGADSEMIKKAISVYSEQNLKSKVEPMLFSTDYEGGANNKTPFNSIVPGVQRFSKGFTKLLHPRWLGESIPSVGMEMCQLHGKILVKELKAVGINYPLSVVSDLATQNLTLLRGISKDPAKVSACIVEIVKQFLEEGDAIFVTKHFPGIGLTHGDTHDGVVVSDTLDEKKLKQHLKPFADLIHFSEDKNKNHLLSIMTTHAMFKGYDPNHLTTESKIIINDLLKGKMGFKGLTVSDAMWMGDYGHLKSDELMPIYAKAFLSGIDLLMIPGGRFKEAVIYFRKVYDQKLTISEVEALEEKMDMSIEEIYENFKERVLESLELHHQVRSQLKYPHEYIKSEVPSEMTQKERTRYYEILNKIGG